MSTEGAQPVGASAGERTEEGASGAPIEGEVRRGMAVTSEAGAMQPDSSPRQHCRISLRTAHFSAADSSRGSRTPTQIIESM